MSVPVSGGCRSLIGYDKYSYHNQSEGPETMGSALERHIEEHDLPAVREEAREFAATSVSANTRRAYEGAIRRLQDWLAGRPLDDATLAEYLASRFEAGHSPATERVLAGFRREGRARSRRQVAGVRWVQAATAAAVAACTGGSVRGLRDVALLAVMSDAELF